MSPVLLFCILIAYFALLLGVAWATSRNANNDSFFIGNKSSNWMLVAFGMVGTTLSGATFISVPGAVGRDGFGYGQILIGYVFGYIAVAYILLPLYYRLKLTSIYHYLDVRLGPPRLPERGRLLHPVAPAGRHRAALPGGQHPAGDHPRQPGRAVLADHAGDPGHDPAVHLPGRRQDHRLDRHPADHLHAVRPVRLRRLPAERSWTCRSRTAWRRCRRAACRACSRPTSTAPTSGSSRSWPASSSC